MLQYKILHIPSGNFVEKQGEYSLQRDLTFCCKFTATLGLKRLFRTTTFILTTDPKTCGLFWEKYGKEEFCIVAVNEKLRIKLT